MSLRITLITARRVLGQLISDRRTLALILVVPTVMIALIRYIMDSSPAIFDTVGLILLAAFPFMLMFMTTSITLLRERTSGTLERLFTTPTAKGDLITGYALAFGLAAAVQSSLASLLAYTWLGLDTAGPAWAVVVTAVSTALFGMALGLFVSAFATTEFQAMQFMPVFVVPQLFLCGLIWPRELMAEPLQTVADVLPLTYAVKALHDVQQEASVSSEYWGNVAIVVGATVVAIACGAATLHRRTR
ncbi:ABC transporter permease [Haloglycomyces albus]|uniref:ABC transporter permease n=1 Tax=Haloglycomyces albus TaxID=526067 RepID=UPI00046D4EB5|nr:ABC transporter permease [Haloglycomyces albus]